MSRTSLWVNLVVLIVTSSLGAGCLTVRERVGVRGGATHEWSRPGDWFTLTQHAPNGWRDLPPVLLVGELGLGPEQFDLGGRGLAPYLARRGFDVFALTWRPPPGAHLAQLFEQEAVEALRIAAANEPAIVVGYGVGGAAAFVQAAESPERVRGVVALAVPLDAAVPNDALAAVARAVARSKADFVPLAALAPLGWGGADLYATLLTHGSAFAPGVSEAMRAALTDVPVTVLADVAGWMSSGDLRLAAEPSYRAAAAAVTAPVLAICGVADNVVHAEAALVPEALPKSHATFEILQRLELSSDGYAHLALVQGAAAPAEVWARIASFAEAMR